MTICPEFPTCLNNVWLYLRKSREDREAEERARREGRDEIETLARHRRTLLDLARKYQHNVTQVIEEIVSGEYISERPEMMRLLDAVEKGEVTAIWVMDFDRLGRGDMADQGIILRTLKESNTLIFTVDKMYDLNNDMDEEWTEFKAFFARRELKMITKRMQRGRLASIQEGKFIGTRPPFGYDVTRDLILIPNSDAAVVKQIFDLYANRGLGCNRIANYLNFLGVKTPMDKTWRGESVLSILKNPVYAGYIVWRKTKVDKRRGTYRQRPENERIQVKGRHVPLVDETTFERTVYIRRRRTHVPVRFDRKVSSPLSGLIKCSKCNAMLVKRPYSKQAPHLICKNPDCSQKSTRLSLVETQLLHALSQWLENYKLNAEEILNALNPVQTESFLDKKLFTSIDDEIHRLKKQHDNLHNLLEQGVYDIETYRERHEKLESELSDLRNRRSHIESEIQKQKQIRLSEFSIESKVTSVLEAYQMTGDVAKQNQLLKTVLEKVVYNKEKWQRRDQFALSLYPLI